jgi:hypothetical protein
MDVSAVAWEALSDEVSASEEADEGVWEDSLGLSRSADDIFTRGLAAGKGGSSRSSSWSGNLATGGNEFERVLEGGVALARTGCGLGLNLFR